MTVRFRPIVPKLLPTKVFEDKFKQAARQMEQDVKGAFEDAVAAWNHQPIWRGYVRVNSAGILISVGTQDLIFKFVDEGTEPHIIRPVKAKVLHWITPSGDNAFAKEVHHPGTKAQKISENIRDIFADGLMYEYFQDALTEAVMESGHAI